MQRIKHSLLRLSGEEKVIGFGAILVVIGSFMPWYSSSFLAQKETVIETAFSGDLGVIGFTIFLIAILEILYAAGDNLGIKLPDFGILKEKAVLFLSAQNAFLILITIAVYTKRSFDFTNAGLRFGIYMALIGACLSTLSAFAEIQKRDRAAAKAFFEYPDQEGDSTREMEQEAEEDEDDIFSKEDEVGQERAVQTDMGSFDQKEEITEEIKSEEVEIEGSFFDEEEDPFAEKEEPEEEVVDVPQLDEEEEIEEDLSEANEEEETSDTLLDEEEASSEKEEVGDDSVEEPMPLEEDDETELEWDTEESNEKEKSEPEEVNQEEIEEDTEKKAKTSFGFYED